MRLNRDAPISTGTQGTFERFNSSLRVFLQIMIAVQVNNVADEEHNERSAV
jgi:hypothetical protein